MAYAPEKKNTLLIPSGPTGNHLFTIVTDPCENGQLLLVSFCTIKEGRFYDPACIVEPGEHAFIRDQSFVEYRMARIDPSAHLVKCVDGWLFKPGDAVTDDLYGRICEGFGASKFVARGMREYFNQWGLSPR